jgi:hypothetical protein
MSRSLITTKKATHLLENIHAENVAANNLYVTSITGTLLNPGLQKLVSDCLNEIEQGDIRDVFLEQLAHFNRPASERNLMTKLSKAGCPETYYEFAIEAKENFAKFFEVMARHASGQAILVAAFKHAYSIFKEKINPYINAMTFSQQSEIFENSVVLYLDQNLTGLPGFDGRMEALGLLYYLADNCFIEYANCLN